jgi:hypothetical protein
MHISLNRKDSILRLIKSTSEKDGKLPKIYGKYSISYAIIDLEMEVFAWNFAFYGIFSGKF